LLLLQRFAHTFSFRVGSAASAAAAAATHQY
jgi:hypothetical protein